MTGLTNYSAGNLMNCLTGQIAFPALPSVWLALFTGVGTDGGSGFTEVSASGTAYARAQVAGPLVTNSGTTTSSPTVSIASVPAWVVAGMTIYDATNANAIGTVQSNNTTSITMTANAAHAVTSGDTVNISAFSNTSGTGPSTITNTAALAFATATGAGFGTVIAFGLYDASTSGNLLVWDYIGAFNWLPATVSAASPGVITAHAHGYSNGDSFIFSVEYGGVAPSFSAGNFNGILTAAGVATDTLDVSAVNTSATGNGMVRKITQQSIPTGVLASFAASSLNANIA